MLTVEWYTAYGSQENAGLERECLELLQTKVVERCTRKKGLDGMEDLQKRHECSMMKSVRNKQ